MTDEEVAGVETFTPVAFQNCTVAAGNHFQQDVTQAGRTSRKPTGLAAIEAGAIPIAPALSYRRGACS